jgi:hypothetical protein
MTEVGYNLLTEQANTAVPSRQFLTGNNETESIVLEAGTANGYSISSNRPLEGDLIYFPMVDKIFEIKFVEHEQIFYQTGRLQTYDLRCELFSYSSEKLDTGYSEIDIVEDQYSLDQTFYQTLLEDGEVLLAEDGDGIVQEFQISTIDAQADNDTVYKSNILEDDIIDFSEKDPWSEGRF